MCVCAKERLADSYLLSDGFSLLRSTDEMQHVDEKENVLIATAVIFLSSGMNKVCSGIISNFSNVLSPKSRDQ